MEIDCANCFIRVVFVPKFKIELVNFAFFGYTEFIPKDQNGYPKKVVITTIGGSVFTLIYLIFGVLCSYLFIDNFVLFTLFGMQYLITLYLFLINILPFIEDSDGSFLLNYFSNNSYSEIIKNALTIDGLILSGEEPNNINSKLFINYNNDYSYFSVKIIYF